MQMSDEAAVAYLAAHANKHVAGVSWECDFGTAMMLVGTWQLVLRNPEFAASRTGQELREFTLAMIDRMAAGDETVRGLLHRGFDAAFDTPARPLANSPVVYEGKFLGENAFRDAIKDDEQIRETLAQLHWEIKQGHTLEESLRFALASFIMGVFDPAERLRLEARSNASNEPKPGEPT